jgi:hypothetical protein
MRTAMLAGAGGGAALGGGVAALGGGAALGGVAALGGGMEALAAGHASSASEAISPAAHPPPRIGRAYGASARGTPQSGARAG